MGLPLVGAKGEEQLLDKLKSYATVTGVFFRLITKKHTEDTASDPFLIFKIVFKIMRIFRYRALHKGRKYHLEHKVRIVTRMTSEAQQQYTMEGIKMQIQNQKLWVGIDVGSKSFHAALDFPMLFTNQTALSVVDLPQREFNFTNAGVKSFLSWVQAQQNDFFAEYSEDTFDDLPLSIVMESTGIYSTQLEKMILGLSPYCNIIIANPEPIKAFCISLNIKNKTDKSDAQVIARYGKERTPAAKKKISPEMEILRSYSRARIFLKDQRTAMGNYHDNVIGSLPQRMCSNIIKSIDKEIAGLDREIDKVVSATPEIKHEVDIITSMPGIGQATAVTLLSELGSLKDYTTRRKITAMSGLNPVRKQSGTSVNSTHLSKKGSPLVRRFLYMCSKTALPRIPALQDLYDRLLAKGNTRMQARCAVMRKMLLILRGMVIADKEFDKNYQNISKSA